MSIIYKPKNVPGEFHSDYNIEAYPNQRADFWFCEGQGYSPVGVYHFGGFQLLVACVGEMRWNLADGQRWNSGDDIRVTTDEEACALINAETVDVVNNCWLELIGDDGESTDVIAGNIDEAIEYCHDYIVRWLMEGED